MWNKTQLQFWVCCVIQICKMPWYAYYGQLTSTPSLQLPSVDSYHTRTCQHHQHIGRWIDSMRGVAGVTDKASPTGSNMLGHNINKFLGNCFIFLNTLLLMTSAHACVIIFIPFLSQDSYGGQCTLSWDSMFLVISTTSTMHPSLRWRKWDHSSKYPYSTNLECWGPVREVHIGHTTLSRGFFYYAQEIIQSKNNLKATRSLPFLS